MSWLASCLADDSTEQDTTLLIVCEGPDGVGKTTLVEEIVELLHATSPADVVEVRHKGPPTEHPLDEYVKPLLTYRPGGNRHVICDRWHLGELVYPEVLGRESLMDTSQRWYIDWFLRSRGAFLAYVDRNYLDVLSTLVTRGDDVVTPEQTLPIMLGYSSAMRASLLEKQAYDITDHGVAGNIVHAARQVDKQADVLRKFTTYVGPHDPIVLILGDVRGPASTHPHDPAFVPYPSSSGSFLLRALTSDAFTIAPTFVGVANACDVDSVPDLIATLRPMHIVTLGQNATKAVARHTTNFGAVPHPQYVRRFHHKHHREYGAAINEAATLRRDLRSWRP